MNIGVKFSYKKLYYVKFHGKYYYKLNGHKENLGCHCQDHTDGVSYEKLVKKQYWAKFETVQISVRCVA